MLCRLAEPLNGAVLVGTLCFKTDVNLIGRVVFLSPFLIAFVERDRTIGIPSIAITTLSSDLFQMSARHAITIAYERLTSFKVVEASPQGWRQCILYELCVLICTTRTACTFYFIARKLVLIEPTHGGMHCFLYPIIGIG